MQAAEKVSRQAEGLLHMARKRLILRCGVGVFACAFAPSDTFSASCKGPLHKLLHRFGADAFPVGGLVAACVAAIRCAESLIAVATPVFTQASEETAQPLKTSLVSDHQRGRSAFWAFHKVLIGLFGEED